MNDWTPDLTADWDKRHAWLVTVDGEIIIGPAGVVHDDVAVDALVDLDDVVAKGEIDPEGNVRQLVPLGNDFEDEVYEAWLEQQTVDSDVDKPGELQRTSKTANDDWAPEIELGSIGRPWLIRDNVLHVGEPDSHHDQWPGIEVGYTSQSSTNPEPLGKIWEEGRVIPNGVRRNKQVEAYSGQHTKWESVVESLWRKAVENGGSVPLDALQETTGAVLGASRVGGTTLYHAAPRDRRELIQDEGLKPMSWYKGPVVRDPSYEDQWEPDANPNMLNVLRAKLPAGVNLMEDDAPDTDWYHEDYDDGAWRDSGQPRLYFFQSPDDAQRFGDAYRVKGHSTVDVWGVRMPTDMPLKLDPKPYSLFTPTTQPLYSEVPIGPEHIALYTPPNVRRRTLASLPQVSPNADGQTYTITFEQAGKVEREQFQMRTGSPGEKMWHTDSPDRRESITQHGLDSRFSDLSPSSLHETWRPGFNYLWGQWMGNSPDTWEVDVTGLTLYEDPYYSGDTLAWFTVDPIEPGRLRLLEPSSRGSALKKADASDDWKPNYDDPWKYRRAWWVNMADPNNPTPPMWLGQPGENHPYPIPVSDTDRWRTIKGVIDERTNPPVFNHFYEPNHPAYPLAETALKHAERAYYQSEDKPEQRRVEAMGLRGDLPTDFRTQATVEGVAAFAGNQQIGTLLIEYGRISNIEVLSEYQRQGVATAMLNAYEEYTGEQVIHNWENMSNEGEQWARTVDPDAAEDEDEWRKLQGIQSKCHYCERGYLYDQPDGSSWCGACGNTFHKPEQGQEKTARQPQLHDGKLWGNIVFLLHPQTQQVIVGRPTDHHPDAYERETGRDSYGVPNEGGGWLPSPEFKEWQQWDLNFELEPSTGEVSIYWPYGVFPQKEQIEQQARENISRWIEQNGRSFSKMADADHWHEPQGDQHFEGISMDNDPMREDKFVKPCYCDCGPSPHEWMGSCENGKRPTMTHEAGDDLLDEWENIRVPYTQSGVNVYRGMKIRMPSQFDFLTTNDIDEQRIRYAIQSNMLLDWKTLGIHWTSDPKVAERFAKPVTYQDGFSSYGLLVEGQVMPEDIVQPGTDEFGYYAQQAGVVGPLSGESEITIRPGASVRILRGTAILPGGERIDTPNMGDMIASDVQHTYLKPFGAKTATWWRDYSDTFVDPEQGYENLPGELHGRLPFLVDERAQVWMGEPGEHHPEIGERTSVNPFHSDRQGDVAWVAYPDGRVFLNVMPPTHLNGNVQVYQAAYMDAEMALEDHLSGYADVPLTFADYKAHTAAHVLNHEGKPEETYRNPRWWTAEAEAGRWWCPQCGEGPWPSSGALDLHEQSAHGMTPRATLSNHVLDHEDNWVYLDGKIAFGGEHHDIARALALKSGYEPTAVSLISNMVARNSLPAGHEVKQGIALGTLKGGYPQIWLSTIDRNHVWDEVTRHLQDGTPKTSKVMRKMRKRAEAIGDVTASAVEISVEDHVNELEYSAFVDGKQVGVFDLFKHADGKFYVIDIRVAKGYQRQGIATALFKRAQEDLGAENVIHSSELTDAGRAWRRSLGKVSSVPQDQMVYIAEGAMERGGFTGREWRTPKGHIDEDPEIRASMDAMTQYMRSVTGLEHARVIVSDYDTTTKGIRASAHWPTQTVYVSRKTTDLELLHESAHLLRQSNEGEGHDQRYCEIARDLYTKHLGAEAGEIFWNLVGLRFKTAMAERTGDPQLDGLLDGFKQEFEAKQPGISARLRNPETSAGACGEIASWFHDWLAGPQGFAGWSEQGTDFAGTFHDPELDFSEPPHPWTGFQVMKPEDFGYTDRTIEGENGHEATLLRSADGNVYLIDWTAAQYGYSEWPMVQRLDGDQWQRTFSKTAMGERGDLPQGMLVRSAPPPSQYDYGLQSVEAVLDGQVIGKLSWSEEAIDVWVSESYQRRGVASAMKSKAEKMVGHTLQHSDDLSSDAQAWAEKTAAATVMYHASPAENRASIFKNGITPSGSSLDPEAVYLFDNGQDAAQWHQHGNDVWTVNCDGLQVAPDPEHEEERLWPEMRGGSWITYDRIGPERLSLIK